MMDFDDGDDHRDELHFGDYEHEEGAEQGVHHAEEEEEASQSVSFQSLPFSNAGSPNGYRMDFRCPPHALHGFECAKGEEDEGREETEQEEEEERDLVQFAFAPSLVSPPPPQRCFSSLSPSFSPQGNARSTHSRSNTRRSPAKPNSKARNAKRNDSHFDDDEGETLNGSPTQQRPQRLSAPLPYSTEPGVAPLIQSAHNTHTSLLSSLFATVAEHTQAQLSQALIALTQLYESTLKREREEREKERAALQEQLENLQREHADLQAAHARLHVVHDTRTERLTEHILTRHIVRSDVTQRFSLTTLFSAWKSQTKRHIRAKKLDFYVSRVDDRESLRLHFTQLQALRVSEKNERKLAEVKFKFETISNEMSRSYEQEIAHQQRLLAEAEAQIEVEREKRRLVEEEMRSLFMQSVSQMNQQALSLFQRVEGTLSANDDTPPITQKTPATQTQTPSHPPLTRDTQFAQESLSSLSLFPSSYNTQTNTNESVSKEVEDQKLSLAIHREGFKERESSRERNEEQQRERLSLSLSPQPRNDLPVSVRTLPFFSPMSLSQTQALPTQSSQQTALTPLTQTQYANTPMVFTQTQTPSQPTQTQSSVTGRVLTQYTGASLDALAPHSALAQLPVNDAHYDRLSDMYSRAVSSHTPHAHNNGNASTSASSSSQKKPSPHITRHYMQPTHVATHTVSQTGPQHQSAPSQGSQQQGKGPLNRSGSAPRLGFGRSVSRASTSPHNTQSQPQPQSQSQRATLMSQRRVSSLSSSVSALKR